LTYQQPLFGIAVLVNSQGMMDKTGSGGFFQVAWLAQKNRSIDE
jgi:hypothetical protein